MAGSTSGTFNAIIDSIITSLESATTIGSPTDVKEKDEHPAIASDNGTLPMVYVVPLVEGKHVFSMTMDKNAVTHTFPVSIVGYYDMPDVDTSLRTVRNYAYGAFDLFKAKQSLPVGQIVGASLEVGYWIGGGKVIHYFILVLSIKAMF